MTSSKLQQAVLAECREWIGTPYRHQGSTKHYGCDCLGLLRGVWRKLYSAEPQALPSYTPDWGMADKREHLLQAANTYLVPVNLARPASVILFRWQPALPVKHLGIVASKNSFIHAYERAGVVETTLGTHWQVKVAAIFDFPDFLQDCE